MFSTSFPGLSYEDEGRDEKALVWAGHVTTQKWQYLTATRQGVAKYSLMKYIIQVFETNKQPKDFSIDIIYV
jgi:hypothetical protein